MADINRIMDDLDYIKGAVRGSAPGGGLPALYFLWGAIIPIGFALPDFAPSYTPLFWLIAGSLGGLFSSWFGARAARRAGVKNAALGRRHGLHWSLTGIAFVLCFIPLATGRMEPDVGAANFLLLAGISYALAGVHLERPLLPAGVVMLGAYGLMVWLAPPYAWTLTGLAVSAALMWAGICQLQAQRADHSREQH